MTHVVVTGAAGFIGSHLVEALLAKGHEVLGVDNFDPFYPRATKTRNLEQAGAHPSFRLLEGDVCERELLMGELGPDSVVVHLAAKAGVRPSLADPRGYTRTNVDGTVGVVEAAVEAGVRRLVFASSSSVYGNDTPSPFREDAPAVKPISPYAATKRAGELFLESRAQTSNLRVAVLRYFTVYGPRQRPDLAIHTFARRMLLGKEITLFGEGTEARDYTFISDIIDGTIAAFEWTTDAVPGVEIFNLGGNEPVNLERLVVTLSDALGVQAKVRHAPLPPGEVSFTSADLTKSHQVLGYAPRMTFDEGIREFSKWYRSAHDS